MKHTFQTILLFSALLLWGCNQAQSHNNNSDKPAEVTRVFEKPKDSLSRKLWDELNKNYAELDKNMAISLLKAGANINTQSQHGLSSLMYMVEMGDSSEVAMVLAMKPDVNAKDASGATALHKAAFLNREAALNMLLASGADVNAKTNDNSTALHWAAVQPYPAILKTLLEHHADANAKNDKGETPLDRTRIKATRDVIVSFGGKSGK